MKQFTVLLCLVLVGFLLISGCGPKNEAKKPAEDMLGSNTTADYYICPMHPSVKSEKPGVCPICHMTLVKVSAVQKPGEPESHQDAMHLSSSRLVLANVTTVSAELRSLVLEIPLAGKIDYAESNTQQITTRYAGRIEKLAISYVGQKVRRGDPVAEIYSPDAISAQREFIVALESSIQQSGISEQPDSVNSDLTGQSRTKLKYWGFTDGQIADIIKTRIVKPVVTIYSPIDGTVIKKNVDLQKYVSPGESLFEVSDLRIVWLQMDVYESDLASVKLGQTLLATIEAYPSQEFRGTISFIGDIVEPSTRTVRVRATLVNTEHKLKPEMFARAALHIPLPTAIAVPATAVIAFGKSTVVWVEVDAHHFSARPVKLGYRAGEYYQVLEGLHKGEKVAASGGYLIDSESQLQATGTSEYVH